MSIQFEEPRDPLKVWAHIQQMIAGQEFNCALWKLVESNLKNFEGKKITKRIETALKAALPEYSVHYSTDHGMHKISIWGNGLDYGRRLTYYLGHLNNSDILDMLLVQKQNTCWELEKSRTETLRRMSKTELYAMVEKWNFGIKALQEVNNWAREYEINYISDGFNTK